MYSRTTRLILTLMIGAAALTTGCVDAIREGAVGGLGSAVESVVETMFTTALLPLQTLLSAT